MFQSNSEVAINPPTPPFISFDANAASTLAVELGMIKFGFHGAEVAFHISLATLTGALSESIEVTLESREGVDAINSSTSSDPLVECVFEEVLHQRREKD